MRDGYELRGDAVCGMGMSLGVQGIEFGLGSARVEVCGPATLKVRVKVRVRVEVRVIVMGLRLGL